MVLIWYQNHSKQRPILVAYSGKLYICLHRRPGGLLKQLYAVVDSCAPQEPAFGFCFVIGHAQPAKAVGSQHSVRTSYTANIGCLETVYQRDATECEGLYADLQAAVHLL
jgi:hypothetical protein